jgi:hypothetical protein
MAIGPTEQSVIAIPSVPMSTVVLFADVHKTAPCGGCSIWPTECIPNGTAIWMVQTNINPLNAELNPLCRLLALLRAHHILHVSRIRVKKIQSFAMYIFGNSL